MITKGQKINDRYQIIRTIGEGGMANVYLAYDTILDRNVAVKILRGDLANDEKFVRRFQREAISASSLSHPNIVEMYDVGEDDGKYFIVMEYVDGTTLKSLIKRRGSLTLPEVIDIMLQLTSGLSCAHDSYIIHRDIKPQNVLILDDGRVKITDFGIAMALNSNELTQTNSVMGSVHYLPPEQANGTGATVKSDIYSLGILMYELLIGKLPFKGDSAVEIAIKQMKEPIPSVIDINQDIPQSVENIILKACAKNPKNRYESSLDMHEDLKTALSLERINEKKLVYEFQEVEEQNKKDNSKTRIKKTEEKLANADEEIKEKKLNKFLIIGTISVLIIGVIMTFIIFLLPKLMEEPDVKIPDVTNMTEVEAEKALKDKGFEVATKVLEEASEDIEKGKVISTSPSKGRSVKKGTEISITLSTGSVMIKVEDYTGKLIEKIKPELVALGLNVLVEEKEYTKDDNVKDGVIESQDVKADTKLDKGDTIVLTVSKIVKTYPNFVTEDYTVEGAQKFCDDASVTLAITYKETSTETAGSIIYQSRAAGTKVVSGVTLRITVAKAVTVTTDTNVPTTPTAPVTTG